VTIRVLVVDGSARDRQALARGLARDPQLRVVATARDAWEARDKIVLEAPDVVTLDVELPRMDGITFLERLMPQYPLPVVVVSSAGRYGAGTGRKALDAGAVRFVPKPEAPAEGALDTLIVTIAARVKEASRIRFDRRPDSPRSRATPGSESSRPRFVAGGPPVRTVGALIAIGASTGGVEALSKVLTGLPAEVPGIVVSSTCRRRTRARSPVSSTSSAPSR